MHVHVDKDSLVFFVNARTGKGSQLATNPQAALCFFWRALAQQVIVDGGVVPLTEAQASLFWQQRPRATALGARASQPEAGDADKTALDARVKDQRSRADFARIKQPAHWVGYRLQPDRIVFWETGWERMRLRHAAERRPDGEWWAGDRQP